MTPHPSPACRDTLDPLRRPLFPQHLLPPPYIFFRSLSNVSAGSVSLSFSAWLVAKLNRYGGRITALICPKLVVMSERDYYGGTGSHRRLPPAAVRPTDRCAGILLQLLESVNNLYLALGHSTASSVALCINFSNPWCYRFWGAIGSGFLAGGVSGLLPLQLGSCQLPTCPMYTAVYWSYMVPFCQYSSAPLSTCTCLVNRSHLFSFGG